MMVQSGVVLGTPMFSFSVSMWLEAVFVAFPSISFICSWRLEGIRFLPDRRPSAWWRGTDEDDVLETVERADVSGLPAKWSESELVSEGDRGAV